MEKGMSKLLQKYKNIDKSKREKLEVSITIGLLCFILVAAIFVQIKTIKNATAGVGSFLKDNSGLRDELLTWQDNNEKIRKALENAEKNLEEIRTNAISNDTESKALEEELKENNKLLGLTDVVGDGVVITLDDNREIDPNEVLNISKYIVHAEDVVCIINELFNAGADAISINGQRIVSTTSIYCDGNIVRINGKMVGVPITINAIGQPERMYYALIRPEGYLDYKGYLRVMAEDGIKAEIEKKTNIVIPKFEGIYTNQYINNKEQ